MSTLMSEQSVRGSNACVDNVFHQFIRFPPLLFPAKKVGRRDLIRQTLGDRVLQRSKHAYEKTRFVLLLRCPM